MLEFREEDILSLTAESGCIVAKVSRPQDVYAASERLLYTAFGVME